MGLGPSKEKIKKILEKSCNENKNLSEQTKLKIEYCKSLSVSETAMNGDSSFSSQNDSMDSDSSRSLGETSSYIDVTNVEGQNITSRSSAVSRSKEFPYIGVVPRYQSIAKQGYRAIICKQNIVFYKVNEETKEIILNIIVSSKRNYINLI